MDTDDVRVLAFVSSQGSRRGGASRPTDDLRWTEMTIYRVGNDYVLMKVGRSDVYHVPGHCMVPAHGRTIIADDLDEDHRPCPKCRPAVWDDLAPFALVVVELDVPTVFSELTPEDLIAVCYQTDSTGSTYFPPVARQVIKKAAKNDEPLAQAWQAEKNVVEV